jgi:hypothetical protein
MTLDSFDYLAIISAVIFGNALSALWAYVMWRFTQYERRHGIEGSRGRIPGHLYLLALVTPAAAGLGAWVLLL